jgi:GAF domain-containing protein
MSESQRLAAAEAFGRIKLGGTTLTEVLRTIADLAKITIPGAGEVTLTLAPAGRPGSATHTGELALAVDEAEHEPGHGPCLDAAAGLTTLVVPDAAAERRWPHWAERAVDAGVRSALAVGLPVDEAVTGALAVYSTVPQAFDRDAVALTEAFAGTAAVTLSNALVYDNQSALVRQLRVAMDSRAVVEQAKGIVMADRRCTPGEAFRILTTVSQETNRKVRDVAAALVARTGPP